MMTLFKTAVWMAAFLANYALSSNLVCENRNSGYETGCSFEPLNFPIVEKEEMELTFAYRFPCIGHQADIVLETDSSSYKLLTMGLDDWLNISLNARSNITIKPRDANLLKTLTFKKGCTLDVKLVRRFPSINTLNEWKNTANYLVQNVSQSIEALHRAQQLDTLLFLTADRLEAVKDDIWRMLDDIIRRSGHERGICTFSSPDCKTLLSFSEMETSGLAESWEKLITDSDGFLHILNLHNFVIATIAGVPTISKDEASESLAKSRSKILEFHIEKVKSEMEGARAFLTKVQSWESELDESLAKIILELREILKKNS